MHIIAHDQFALMLYSCCSGNSCAVTRAEYAEVLQILVEHLQLQSAKGSGVTDQVLQFVAVLKDDLVKTAVDGNQQGKAGGTIWLLKESLKSQLCLYASLVRGNGDAISEVLKPMLTCHSPTAVEVAVEVCTATLVSKDVHFPHQAFLEVFPVDLCRAGEDMQLTVSLSLNGECHSCIVPIDTGNA